MLLCLLLVWFGLLVLGMLKFPYATVDSRMPCFLSISCLICVDTIEDTGIIMMYKDIHYNVCNK